ncbi:MAG TPA: LacI family DNA-binding transcriptional regulator [Gemmatimonadaceae bacterium]|nr:LacI family DNA-binding transcriptional regulator [Gemmatimonadaceae bacterium]
MKPTIRDVAREAGVSVATVSRVLNGSGPVHEDTRERIRAVARALRYVPDSAARSLITRRTETLGVVLPDLYGEFFSEVMRGLDQAARRRGYHVLVSSSHADRAEIEAAVGAMMGRVDGMVVMAPDVDAAALAANLPESLPVVLLNSGLGGEDDAGATNGGTAAASIPFDVVDVDNYGGARGAVRHLIALGHSRVAIIKGSERNHDARERLRGYRDALAGAGLEAPPRWEIAGDFTEGAGHEAARRVVRMRPRPTALFAANDTMAIGALSALRESGARVPEDVAVVGFDDIPLARYMSPPLTSVHVDIARLGGRAVERLLEIVADGTGENRSARRRETLPTTLVVRDSCGGQTS